MSTPAIELRDIRASYDGLEVLRDLSLTVRDGELVAILGPSGSGKSTTFSVLTGALAPDGGEILVHGEPVADGAGRFAYMPQQDALFPWRRVRDNLTLGLEVQGVPRARARERVAPLVEPFGLAGFEDAWPFQLSGGMRQRAALLRTVVQDRPVLLLDEPFGALDALTRAAMQRWLEGLWETYRWTVLLVTHDVREAIFLADRVEVFSARPAGVTASVEVPFARPRTAALLTDPEFAALEARLLDDLLGAPA